MIKVKNRFIVALLMSAISISSISGIAVISKNNFKVVHATTYPIGSQTKLNAYSKLDNLKRSLKINYLGIKNQSTWEMYIKELRVLIGKLPTSEKKDSDILTLEVNKAEKLVKALSRINQVEKSMQPKSEGGYGNALIPKNVPQWREYIRLANIDLEKVDKLEFQKQYEELITRRDIVNNNLEKIMGIEIQSIS